MDLNDFNYNFPRELVAQKPAYKRDRSKLMIYYSNDKKVEHGKFFEVANYLRAGDVLVLNDSKVMPFRLIGRKKDSGGRIEVLLLKQIESDLWEALVGGKGKKEGLEIIFDRDLRGILANQISGAVWNVRFNLSGHDFFTKLDKIGEMPLPPYIKNLSSQRRLKKIYQTIYAKHAGSAAAPTAGLHFTQNLFSSLNKKGVQIEYLTLHVGLGTFEPVRKENILEHEMHSEIAEIKADTANRILQAKKEGRRIIAVGTTSVRVLEGVVAEKQKWEHDEIVSTNIFIYPGFKFKLVDALITNFHLPKSTLLMLVSAFIGRKEVLKLYDLAVEEKYRFYSFGDAMLLINKS